MWPPFVSLLNPFLGRTTRSVGGGRRSERWAVKFPSSAGAAAARGNSNAAVFESHRGGGQHLEGDWAVLDLPLRIPQERDVLRDKVKKGRQKGQC